MLGANLTDTALKTINSTQMKSSNTIFPSGLQESGSNPMSFIS